MAVELIALRHFLAVAEELSISRAAARLHLAQSALSRQMTRLESEIAAALFVRTSRGVRLTPAGEVLVEHARRTLAEAETAVVATRRAARLRTPPVRVGFYCDTAAVLMPAVVTRHRARWPRSAVEVEQLDFRTQLRRLREGSLDVAFVRPFCDIDDLRSETLLPEPVVAVLPADHPLAGRRSVTVAELADEPWIVLPAATVGDGAYDRTLTRLRRAGVAGVVSTAPTVQAGVGLAAAGYGVFPCPRSAAQPTPPRTRLVPLEDWTTGVQMVWAAGPVRAAVQRLLAVARELTCDDQRAVEM
jgi:DNA-binding transcriptional LysR family regulator